MLILFLLHIVMVRTLAIEKVYASYLRKVQCNQGCTFHRRVAVRGAETRFAQELC